MRTALAAFVLVIVAAGAAARAASADGFWDPKDTERRDYLMSVGDRHLADAKQTEAVLMNSPSPPPDLVKDFVADKARTALVAYEKAIDVGPETLELHYRAFAAARILADSTGGKFISDRDALEAMVHHIDAVRRLEPLDPREDDLALSASLAYSRLGGLGGPDAEANFEKGIREYEHYRAAYGAALTAKGLATAYSNEAELLMAVGRLDEAIRDYRTSVELNPYDSLGAFGLAVAYDRNGEWSKAVEAMTQATVHGEGVQRLKADGVFFVPNGDIHYYYALFQQMFGNPATAAVEYNRFLARCKDTRYAARARAHLGELHVGSGADVAAAPDVEVPGARRR